MPFDNAFEGPFGDIEILMDARRRIADSGHWLRGQFRYRDRHCLVAALSVASQSPGFDRPNQTERRLARTLVRQLPRTAGISKYLIFATARYRLATFNDRRRTQHEDVLELFDRTIEHLQARVPMTLVA
jgi:hypothetical protein